MEFSSKLNEGWVRRVREMALADRAANNPSLQQVMAEVIMALRDVRTALARVEHDLPQGVEIPELAQLDKRLERLEKANEGFEPADRHGFGW